MKSPIVLLASLLRDAQRLEPDVKGLDRDLFTIKFRFEHEGVSFLTVTLPSICDVLDRALADGQFTCPPGLKKVRGGAIPRLFSGMLCKVFDTESGLLLESPSLSAIKLLREVLRLFKKLALSSDRDEDLDRKAKDEFFETDKKCSLGDSFSERESFILDSVCRVMLPDLESFDERELLCKHGPGAVAESLRANQKWKALTRFSPRLEELGFDCMFYSDVGIQPIVDSSIETRYGTSGTCAKLISVLKSSTSRRTITIEPVVRQFVQQGFNTLLRSSIERCPVLGNCLALTDQSKNQQLALDGSLTGRWSTIDLKSASDLLSLRMVSRVFRFHPSFLEGVIDCRSSEVRCDKRRISLEKYAGMGNATTFPVQSVVFAVLAIAALLDGTKPSYRNILRCSRFVRVYGDDIIVPTDKAHQVVDWIHKAGLTVNLKKTFLVGNFRESCGVDAFRGIDVTPLYVRHCPVAISTKEPEIIAHLVSLSNQAWKRGLYDFSDTIRTFVDNGLKKPLPLVRSDSASLGWHTHQEITSVQRWNEHLHRFELFGTVQVPVKIKDPVDGYAALLKFFHVPLLGRETGHLMKTPKRFLTKIARRWVPV